MSTFVLQNKALKAKITMTVWAVTREATTIWAMTLLRWCLPEGEDEEDEGGHDYMGHNCIGHNYMGHNCIGHNYAGHNYIEVAPT